MKRHIRRSRSRLNGVGPYHDHLAAILKKGGGLKGKSADERKKLFTAAAKKASKLAKAGKPVPKGARGDYAARNEAAKEKYGRRRKVRGGLPKSVAKSLSAERRAEIRKGGAHLSLADRAAMLLAAGAKASTKTTKTGKTMYRVGNMIVSKAVYEQVAAKPARKPRKPRTAAAAKPAAAKATAGKKPAGKKPTAEKVTGVRTDKNGRKLFFLAGKRVGEAAYMAAKPKAKTRPAKVSKPTAKKSTRAKKANPSFGMVLDGVKQFGRDFFTVQGVGGAAVVGVAHGFVAPMIAEKLNEYVPQRVTIPVLDVEVGASDFAFTATGLVAGALLGGLGYAMGRPNLGLGLGLLAAGSGVVIDTVGFVMNARGGGSEMGAIDNNGDVYGVIDNNGDVYGDVAITNPAYGGWSANGVVEYGAVGAVYGAYGAECASEYADSMAGDAQYSGPDFSAAEGQALMDGPKSWMARFGRSPKRAMGVRSSVSRHAGKEGHRWGWLIKLVGMEKAKQIAALSPEKRLAVIDSLRKQAISSLANLMATQASGVTTELSMAPAPKQNLLPAPEQAGLDFTGAAGGAAAAGGALSYGYGTTVFAGGGF